MGDKVYIAIDLKSFYASVECVERGLDALTTNLVVADQSRTEKTICLAVSPSLKAYGISGRARLFEVVQRVREINRTNRGKPVDYIVAPPRMAYYIEYSAKIYGIYLKYVAPKDIQAYSIDEVFIDATHYLDFYKCSARDLAMRMIQDVLRTTGITATAGIGTNLYLAKVAMDIVAKHIPADKDGVRIAQLDERSYRQRLWDHQPITDFWRVGRGTARRLEAYGIFTMGDLARCSVRSEELLYREFGVNAELLIDHAWGWEPCTMEMIKAYKPSTNSLSSGQVLKEPYSFEKARVVIKEMAEAMVFELLRKGLVTNQVVLTVGYDAASVGYSGPMHTDRYGRKVPKHAHGTGNLGTYTCLLSAIGKATVELYDKIVNPTLLIRRLTLCCNRVIRSEDVPQDGQLDLFASEEQTAQAAEQAVKEERMQRAMLAIKDKYGKNSILRALDFEEGATTRERNSQIGGHKA